MTFTTPDAAISFHIDKNIPNRSLWETLGVTSWDVIKAAGRESFDDTPENLAINIGKINYQKHFNPNKLTKEEFTEKYADKCKDSGLELEYDPNITEELADYLIQRQKRRKLNEYIISKGKGGFAQSLGIFGASVATSLLSPTNIAVSLIPGVGGAKWAAFGLKYGKLAATAAKGPTNAAVFQAGFEPVVAYSRHLEQRPYTLAESIENIGVAAAFGASINALGYGIGRLKDKLIHSPTQDLHPQVSSGNAVIDKELRTHINEVLNNTTHPEGVAIHPEGIAAGIEVGIETGIEAKIETGAATAPYHENIQYLQKQKLALYDKYKDTQGLKKLFDAEHEFAEFERKLHKDYITNGDENYLPKSIREELHNKKQKLDYLREKSKHKPEYQEYLTAKEQVDAKIQEQIKYLQEQTGAYDLSPEDLYIAISQLEDGKHIDLADPNNAKSIYETASNASSNIDIADIAHTADTTLEPTLNAIDGLGKGGDKGKNADILENVSRYISSHKSKKIGAKQLLRGAALRQQTIRNKLLCDFWIDIDKAELKGAFKAKEYQADIARELYNITANKTKQQPSGFTGSKTAYKIAEIIHKYQTLSLERANRAGANIAQIEGYITKQRHSAKAIKEMGYRGWRNFILPLLDLEVMRENGPIDLERVYTNLATGLHFKDPLNDASNFTTSFTGSSNLADKISKSRKLIFKSADSWLIYNEKCGEYNLPSSVILGLENIGKTIGLLEVFGENPQHMFDSIKTKILHGLQQEAICGNPTASKEIRYFQSSKLDNIFDIMLGRDSPANPTLAKVAASIRSLKNTAALGFTLISSIPDIAIFANELGNNGIPILKSYAVALNEITASMTSKERREFARFLGIAADSALGLSYDRLQHDSPTFGAVSKLSTLFFKLNCMEWWDSSVKSATGLALSNNLAEQVHLNFNKLPPLLKQQLSKYGINQDNWHLYKYLKQSNKKTIEKATDNITENTAYLIPDCSLIPDNEITKHLAKLNIEDNLNNRQILRDDLSNALRSYYLDKVDTSTPTAHAAEKAAITLGTKSGTIVGEAVRFFMQFKNFPVLYTLRPLHAATLGKIPAHMRSGEFTKDMLLALKHPSTLTSMTQLLTGTTVLGYVSLCAKALIEGKELPDPTDPKTWVAAATKGGGLGIFGDFIFAEHDRYGKTFMQEVMGPVPSEFNSIASIYTKYKYGDLQRGAKEIDRFIERNKPFRNLFYLVPAMRYWNGEF